MWLLIIVVVVLLLRAMQTSQSAAKISMKCTPASNAPTAGDCFKSGNAPVAGVPERGYPQPGPVQSIHCMHTLPIEISFPVAPPPLQITRPTPPVNTVRPIVRPPINYLSASGTQIPVRRTTCGIVTITSGGLMPRRRVSGKSGCIGCGYTFCM